jgi:AcrR family transcriptional regulator
MPATDITANADKRERILDAALELFAERGFHGTPVPMVAEHAKVGAGTIYRYFANKEALVNALFRREKQQILEAMLRGFPMTLPPRKQFGHFFRSVLAYAEDHRDSFRFLEHHHHAYLDDESKALEGKALMLAHGYFVETGKLEVTKDVAPEVLMSCVWGAIVHLMRDAWAGRLTLTPALIDQAELVLWEAIRR